VNNRSLGCYALAHMFTLLTGASGHVGANLVRELLRRRRRVRVLVHRNEAALVGLAVERVRGDVTDLASLRAACDGVDVVFHLAAVISIDGDRGGVVPRTNVGGTRNIVAAALERRVRRMVHVSSVHAFMQEPLDQPLDEQRAQVNSPSYPAYDRSKAAGESEVRDGVARGLDAVIVNPTGIIGPFDYGPSRMGRVFRDLCQRRLPALVGGGFNWVDVRDVVAGALAAEERGRTGENYLVGGHWHSLEALAAMIHAITGIRSPAVTCPMWLARFGAPFAVACGRALRREPLFTIESLHALRANRRVVIDKAARELGYMPRPTLETIRSVCDWFGATAVGRAQPQHGGYSSSQSRGGLRRLTVNNTGSP
jgi:dihydroflavonol-4-reductase